MPKAPSSAFRNIIFPSALLFLIVLVSYSNTMDAAWQMDDKPNILDNAKLHIDNLMPETLYQTFFASPGSQKKLYRPLPCLTFAINWYLSQADPNGYRAINILIHVLTATFLFSTINELFKTATLGVKFSENETWVIAILSAAIWALHPIQTQAVTYIVQRMTSMATLFYIMGLFLYIKARHKPPSQWLVLLYLGCFASFVLSMASKENAATFPLSVILVEIAFFSKKKETASAFFSSPKASFCMGLLLFIAAAFYFTRGNPFSFLNGYVHRSFSLTERLLTEFRVVVFYLSQIFYPHPDRFSIDHEVPISTTLVDPWTTLPAILIVVLLIILGCSQIKKRPLLGFAILFFFLNHLVESTVIPLEIIFEHRNYLPTAFIFVPVSWGFIALVGRLRAENHFLACTIALGIVLIIGNLGFATYLRNMAWASTWTLWTDAARKAPGNARPLNVLAIELGWNQAPTPENLDRAIYFFHKSFDLYRSNKFQEADILGNIAAIHFKKGEYHKAVEYYKMTLQMDPFFIKERYHLAETLAVLQEWDEASIHLDIVLREGAPREIYYNLKGFVLLWQGRPQEALPFFRKALSLSPLKANIYNNIGVALSRLGSTANAEWFLNRARHMSPGNMLPLLSQIENSLVANTPTKAERYIHELLSTYSLNEIQENLENIPKRRDIAPMFHEMIMTAVNKAAFESQRKLAS